MQKNFLNTFRSIKNEIMQKIAGIFFFFVIEAAPPYPPPRPPPPSTPSPYQDH